MRNFLRIRDGDRFWYERHLSQEVNKCGVRYHQTYVKATQCVLVISSIRAIDNVSRLSILKKKAIDRNRTACGLKARDNASVFSPQIMRLQKQPPWCILNAIEREVYSTYHHSKLSYVPVNASQPSQHYHSPWLKAIENLSASRITEDLHGLVKEVVLRVV